MKNQLKKLGKILVILLLIVTLTGCTQQLKDSDGKIVKNETTGQTITKNIICKPTDKKTIKIYKDNKVNIEKLPDCNKMKIASKYEGIWNSIFVRPLAFLIVKIGQIVSSTAISIVIITLILRLFLFPMTKKTLLQSEKMKDAKPELDRLEKKYANKTDQESMTKKSQEMMQIYQKYEIKPLSGCLFALIQIPILFGLWEAINRVPAIFEETFLGINMGTTPMIALGNGDWYYLVICAILVTITYFSYKLNPSMSMNGQDKQNKIMTIGMTIFIGFMSFTLPTAIAFYWITTSGFTIFQNIVVKRRKDSWTKEHSKAKQKKKQ